MTAPADGREPDVVGRALAAVDRQGTGQPEPGTRPAPPHIRVASWQAGGVCALLRHHPDLRFDQLLDLTAAEGSGPGSGSEVVYQLRSLSFGHRLQVSAAIGGQDGPATARSCWPGAEWPEREVEEMLGIRFGGVPDRGRLLTPAGLAGHPLRRRFPRAPAREPARPAGPGPGTGDLALGPTDGLGLGYRLELELQDEEVTAATVVPGYQHSGLERLAEDLGYHQVAALVERVAGPDPVAAGLATVLGVEALLAAEVPPRARRLRIFLAELSRLQSHLSWLARQARAAGFDPAAAVAADLGETTADLCQEVTGRRRPMDAMRVGGVAVGAPDGLAPLVRARLKEVRAGMRLVRTLWLGSRSWQRRSRGRAVLDADQAAAWGVTGPALRAAGVAEDVRRSRPYGGYENLDFEVAVGEGGDLLDRCAVRVAEVEESARILEQVSADLPAGPVVADGGGAVRPAGERGGASAEEAIHHAMRWMAGRGLSPPVGARVYQPVEGARGELAVYLVSDGAGCPCRLHLRSPSLMHAQVLPRLLAGLHLDEVLTAAVSMDVCAAEMDR